MYFFLELYYGVVHDISLMIHACFGYLGSHCSSAYPPHISNFSFFLHELDLGVMKPKWQVLVRSKLLQTFIICTLALDSPKEIFFHACPHVVFKKLH